jgi:twitching motility protein PilT
VNSIDRLVEVFAAEEKPLVRMMLAESLRLVVAQVLVRR